MGIHTDDTRMTKTLRDCQHLYAVLFIFSLTLVLTNALPSRTLLGGSNCTAVTTVDDLNLTEFTRKTWYIQQQQVNGYQSADDLFCVAATYADEGRTVPLFSGTVLSVYNYAVS